jgi:hypothetical protein
MYSLYHKYIKVICKITDKRHHTGKQIAHRIGKWVANLVSDSINFFLSSVFVHHGVIARTSVCAGVGVSFSRHSPNWRVVQNFHSPKQKATAKIIEMVSEMEKKLARLASGLIFLLANPKFYSHLAS